MAELLYRSLHLARRGNIARHVATHSRLDDLLEKASQVLLDLAPSEETLKRFDVTSARAAEWGARTWVEVAARLEFPSEDEYQRVLPERG